MSAILSFRLLILILFLLPHPSAANAEDVRLICQAAFWDRAYDSQ